MRLKLSIFFLSFLIIAAFEAGAEETLTWQDCVRQAALNHPDLISAQESIKQEQADKKITASALFPQIDSNLSGSTAKASGATTDTYTYGLTGTQLLFDAGKTSNNVKAAEENIKASEHDFKFTSSEVRLRLRTAFINLLKAQKLLDITQEIYNIRRGNLELITLRYESGLEHKGALMNAQANLADAEFEVHQAKRGLQVSQRQLIKEMGRSKFTSLRVEEEFKVSDEALEKPDLEGLAAGNPSLAKFTSQKNFALFSIKAARAEFFPGLSAEAGANKRGSKWPPEDDRWNAGLVLSLPLFEGGLRRAQIERAKAIYNQAEADEQSAKDGIILTLEQAWKALQDALETVGVQNRFLEAAEERSRIAEAQYSLGMIQFDNWIIIQDNLVGAKKAFLDARANALLAEASWIQAKGETLEYAQK
ncbi:MAG: TolC family protein [Candidatus Omnitrophota bacterium]